MLPAIIKKGNELRPVGAFSAFSLLTEGLKNGIAFSLGIFCAKLLLGIKREVFYLVFGRNSKVE
ncbi:hypothetical protein A2415_00190 [candidate division WWE3 bacterium RIFOXYC1_FULL_39_7]|uniref:Uncharacterized protein n=1 Tax=candidate division WWE3 bacterium RIFOXYC1_FULL_39_7 TaxID=1802643 RepID=A0A1F4WI48_UNCKA|nr:MAG: hypothetical protein A2415_00190 [candidate division WWE3 bacterium RIFOXYC1_FULL_39_7]